MPGDLAPPPTLADDLRAVIARVGIRHYARAISRDKDLHHRLLEATDSFERQERFRFRKDRLVAAGHDAARSEAQIMRDLGWLRIHDCGSWRYRWRR